MRKAACNSLEWMNISVICKDVLKLLSESKSICILLDKLDEADIDVAHLDKQSKIEFNICGENSHKSFIMGLLSDQIFPKTKKSLLQDLVKCLIYLIITSRNL